MLDKKELKKQYKQTLPKMGIYKITNLISGKFFIGKGMNVPGKINSSKFQLNMGSHMNKDLQKDFKQLGEDKFSFEVVDYLDPKNDDEPGHDYTADLAALEDLWLEKLQPFGENGYNIKK